MVMDKASADLLQDEDVKEFYLGLRSGDDSIRSFADVKQYRRKKRWLS
jgi:branched-chain amino acid transport system ATP-binding protein